MSFQNTTKSSNGEILTGKLWRKIHPFFNDLPFYTEILRMDEMAGPLESALGEGSQEGCYRAMLVKCSKGLDDVYPFSDTPTVDVILREAEQILSPHLATVSPRNASRIWGFISKFAMLDRFSKTLGVAQLHPGMRLPRKICSSDYLGPGSKILEDLNPPTKLLEKFMKTWREHERTGSQYFVNSPTSSSDWKDPAGVALTLSTRLITVVKAKNILNIESGLEMIAIGMAISSENNGVFPELSVDVKPVLRRLWADRMDPQRLEYVSNEIQTLHRAIKNVMEIVFSISPLLALSTQGWSARSINSVYLLRIFNALGNGRPQILVQLEDCVLEGIIAISEGKPREEAMRALHERISPMVKDLGEDNDALNWFNLSIDKVADHTTPPPTEYPTTPAHIPGNIRDQFHGLASPPESRYNSPIFPIAACTGLQRGNPSPSRCVNPRDLHDAAEPLPGSSSPLQGGNPTCDTEPSPAGSQGEKPASFSLEDNAPPIGPSSPLQRGMPAASRCDNPRDFQDRTEPLPPASLELISLKDDKNKEDATMVDVQSMDSSSHPQEDDAVMGTAQSRGQLSQEENSSMVGVVSGEAPLERQEIEEVKCSDPSGSGSDLSDLEDEVGEAKSENGLDLSQSADNEKMEDESMRPPSASKEQQPDLSDSEDGGHEEGRKINAIASSDSSEKRKSARPVVRIVEPIAQTRVESNRMSSDFEYSVQLAAQFEPRRSSRNIPPKKRPTVSYVDYVPPRKSSSYKKKTAFEKDEMVHEEESEDERPKLSSVGKATFHPTLYTDIVGWGSTVEAGAKAYRHVPVQIVPPGDVDMTGEDTKILGNIEASIQGDFINGLPPHLQPDAKNMTYFPGSGQSRIFVASHSEFMGLDARDIQDILRDRLILVHGNPIDYSYGWDLASFGRVFDVDMKTSVQVSTNIDPEDPELSHHQGTLRDFHRMTTTMSDEDRPPLNAISLPAHRRNLYIPSQFGSVASHEVAQSRIPHNYEAAFEVPDFRGHMEWSLIGGKGAVSPFHVDSVGLGTAVVVLEGSKYWIVITRMGEHDTICSVDSLGPGWNPYFFDDGEKLKRFRFEGVHLQKGDMLIMPGGVPHSVVTTSNAICVGRHFYGKSTIRSSVIANVHTFLLQGSLTNQDLPKTRTLLNQLMVFWSVRLDKTDVDGAHIPDLSSNIEFFDLLYLGVFIILSPAFDTRFYHGLKPPARHLKETAYATSHFHSLLHVFSKRYIIVLEGEAVSHSYVLDRMLGEFAAASVLLAKIMIGSDGIGDKAEVDDKISSSTFREHIEDVLLKSSTDIIPYYSRCLERGHKDFLWTGPKVQILPRSDGFVAIISLTTPGEMVDLPSHQIYTEDLDPIPPIPQDTVAVNGKRRVRAGSVNLGDERAKKRGRQS